MDKKDSFASVPTFSDKKYQGSYYFLIFLLFIYLFLFFQGAIGTYTDALPHKKWGPVKAQSLNFKPHYH